MTASKSARRSLLSMAAAAAVLGTTFAGQATMFAGQATAVAATATSTTTLSTLPAGLLATGDTAQLTARVASAGPQPTASVTFMDGPLELGAAAVSGGVAVLHVAALPAGTLTPGSHALTAVYAGDSGTAGSTSAPVSLDVYFADVPPAAQFYGDVNWLVGQNITTGFADGAFHPSAPVSRQAMAAFLYRFQHPAQPDAPACSTSPFWDVPVANQFCGAEAWLAADGISIGYPDKGHRLPGFHPTAAVSRQAMAAFLYRLEKGSAAPPACTVQAFWDVSLAQQFCPQIAWLVGSGVTKGFDDHKSRPGYHPSAAVSRQAMAAFLHRLATLGASQNAPSAVTGLTVVASTTSTLSVSWTNPASETFTGVMIRRNEGTTVPTSAQDGTLVADTAAVVTSFTDTGLTAGTSYAYALFAHDFVPNFATAATVMASTTSPPLITISDMTYSGSLTVAPGATVTVRNNDFEAHTLTDKVHHLFNTGTIPPNGGTRTFVAPSTPGSYPFGCLFHPEMAGTLLVQ